MAWPDLHMDMDYIRYKIKQLLSFTKYNKWNITKLYVTYQPQLDVLEFKQILDRITLTAFQRHVPPDRLRFFSYILIGHMYALYVRCQRCDTLKGLWVIWGRE